jgi:hypothetical protein
MHAADGLMPQCFLASLTCESLKALNTMHSCRHSSQSILSINTTTIHTKYKLPLYIAALYFPKTMNQLDLAIAKAADIRRTKHLLIGR